MNHYIFFKSFKNLSEDEYFVIEAAKIKSSLYSRLMPN